MTTKPLRLCPGMVRPRAQALGLGRAFRLGRHLFQGHPRLKGDPAPVRGSVPIINAAGSPQGREFATDNANFLFTPAIDPGRSREEIAALKAQAAARAAAWGC